ncbi:MAG: DUF6687 family protein [Acidimicrobiales bacterium]
MTSFGYVPYQDLDGQPSIIVDGSAADGTVLTLSHWPKSPCPPGLEANLSAQMAYLYLDHRDNPDRRDLHQALQHDAVAVSNNHFDQDGLVSMFALLHPAEALDRRQMLIEVAQSGDFAVYTDRNAARVSMVLSAYSDPARSPLNTSAGVADDYSAWCSLLYAELLPRLTDICDHPDNYAELWADEDRSLSESEEAIRSKAVTIEEDPALDVAIFHVPEDAPDKGGHLFAGNWRKGLHPMAMHNATKMFRVILVRGSRYELYYRYESWVQYRTSRPLPRVDLAPLADQLNALEQSEESHWKAGKFSAIAPELVLVRGGGGGKSPESTIGAEQFVETAKRHLAEAPPAWDPYAAATAET